MSKKSKAEERAAKASAALAERQRRERRRNILTVGAILGVIAIIVVVILVVVTTREGAEDEAASRGSDYDVSIGDEDAPHEIIVYEDFLCPVCGALEAASRDKLAAAAEAGDVYVSYRPFNLFQDEPLRDYSVASAAAFAVVLEESGEEVAKEYHDLLYENQPPESGPYPDADWLVDLAVEAGATEADVREGIENGEGGEWVEQATAEATDPGIDGTPTIYLDGEQFQEGRTWDDIADNLVAAVD